MAVGLHFEFGRTRSVIPLADLKEYTKVHLPVGYYAHLKVLSVSSDQPQGRCTSSGTFQSI